MSSHDVQKWKRPFIFFRVQSLINSPFNCLEPPVNRFAAGRRKSVFAEQYDPEEDNDDEEANKVIFPKTDEQRSRLCDSVKNILLFRALDPEQVCEIDFFFVKCVGINFSIETIKFIFRLDE